MKIQIRLSAEADAAALRYERLTEMLKGLFSRALDDRDFGTARAASSFRKQAYRIANAWMNDERGMVMMVAEKIASEAHHSTFADLKMIPTEDATDDAGDTLAQTCDYILRELGVQIERDLASLFQTLARMVIRVTISARAQNIPVKAALIKIRMGSPITLAFVTSDRASRKLRSRSFVRSLWRHALLSLYNETVLLVLSDQGDALARIEHLDVKAPVHDTLIALAEDATTPSYYDLRDEVFHPDSDAVVRAHR